MSSENANNLSILFNRNTEIAERNAVFEKVSKDFLSELEKIKGSVLVEIFPGEELKPKQKKHSLSLGKAVRIAFKKAFSDALFGSELEYYLKHYFLTKNGCFYELAKWYFYLLDVSNTLGSFRFGRIYYKDFPHCYEACHEDLVSFEEELKNSSVGGV